MINRFTRFLIFVILIFPLFAFSQGEFNNWYFGFHAGVTFKSGTPVALTNCNSSFFELYCSATVSDSAGNLLFYVGESSYSLSQHGTVYNRTPQKMDNGQYLYTGGARQGYLTIQKLDDDSAYYLFTMDEEYYTGSHPYTDPKGLTYSVIDMRLNGGLGDIVAGQKSIQVPGAGQTGQMLSGTRHRNNHDVWITVRNYRYDNVYLTYLITSAGIDTVPLVTNSLVHFAFPYNGEQPRMIRFSPDGTKLACIYTDALEYCQFNAQTGHIIPLFTIHYQANNDPCAEFSINSRYLYITLGTGINQYDATKTDSALFMQSKLRITDSLCFGAWLQRGPDNRIYVTDICYESLGVIHSPNIQGTGCDYQRNAVPLAGNWCYSGLPQFVQQYRDYIHHTGECLNQQILFTSTIRPAADSVHWDFGDPGSGSSNYSNLANPTHIYSNVGTYIVELFVRHIDNRTDTAWQTITIMPDPEVTLGPDIAICDGDSITFDAGACSGCNYLWKDLGSGFTVGTDQTFKTGQAGTYAVIVTNFRNCIGSDTIQLQTTPVPTIINNPVSKSICSGESTNIPLISNFPGTTFHWTVTLTSGNVTGFTPDSGLFIDQVLINSLSTPGILIYHITPTAGSCSGSNVDFTVTVNAVDSVKVSISVSNNPFCAGASVTFNAIPANGGSMLTYQWKVNGVNAGTDSSTYSFNPVSGDSVRCIMTSNRTCVFANPASSNKIIMTGALPSVITFIACIDTITTTNAQPIKLKGGIPLGGTYSGAGVTNGIFYPAIAGVGNHQITYTYTNAALCSANAFVTIVTVGTVGTSCGQPITDIRDGKSYQTVQIGSQCWLAEDLNYGIEINSNTDQRDNCIPEKYHNPASSIQHPAAVYQWDEIMNYDETFSTQGLCPPGWHVPSEADWNTLFVNYISNAFAGSPLKYSGFSGFNALLFGARHMNKTSDYQGFATFFWSSTTHSVNKAWAHGMNVDDPSVSLYPAFRSNAFSVRCLKD